MELGRFKIFFGQLLLSNAILGLFIISFPMHARRMIDRAANQDSMTNAFDAVINQLDGKRKQVPQYHTATMPESKSNAVDNYIQALVNSIDVTTRSSIARKNSLVSRQIIRQPIVQEVMPEVQNEEDYPRKRRASLRKPHKKSVQVVVKSKPKKAAVINTSIDWEDKDVDISTDDFESALNNFKDHKDFGQVALQQVIDLLDAELNLVRQLVAGNTGAAVQEALDERNILLQRTIPLVVAMYDRILTIATYDNKHNETLNRQLNHGKRLLKSLTAYDQKLFLSTLENKIERYQAIMRDLQHAGHTGGNRTDDKKLLV